MNLLPNTERESLKKGIKMRLVVVVLFLISTSFFAGFILLLPSYFLTPGQLFDIPQSGATDEPGQALTKEIMGLPEEINFKLKFLESSNKGISATEYVTKIVSIMPAEITFNAISLAKNRTSKEKNGTVISITGKALNRDSLVSFSTQLKSSGLFTEVNMPVSNLAKDKNLPFSMTLFIENQ